MDLKNGKTTPLNTVPGLLSKEALKRQVDATYATEWGRSVAFLLRLAANRA